MKNLSLLFLFSIMVVTSMAQTIKGKIISSTDKEPVAYATVKLKLSGTTTLTNLNGEFNIEKNDKLPTDTIVVSNIGYFTVRIATNDLPKNGIISLKEDQKTLSEVGVKSGKKQYKMVNEFSYSAALYSIEKDTSQSYVSSKFPIAKAFTADIDSFKLESIHVGRFIETVIPTAKARNAIGKIFDAPTSSLFYDLKKPVERAIFNLYIIYPDVSGEPTPLSEAIKIPVDLNDRQADVEIDLRGYNIRPKQRNFYVCLEWLPILPNQTYSLGIRGKERIYRQVAWPIAKSKKNDGSAPIALVYEIGYEPFVSIYKVKTESAKPKYVWVKNQWVPVAPEPNAKTDDEMALSVKISYY